MLKGTVAFYTLGCKLNFSESDTISQMMEKANYGLVDFGQYADIYVINTCSVTENADKKCKRIVQNALAINSEALIVIIGCYAQLKPKEISEIPGVDLVLGAHEKFELVKHLDQGLEKKQKAVVFNKDIREVYEFIPGFSKNARTRTFFKVQDGCDYFCTFCTIPLARGQSRSASIENTISKAQEIAKTGVKEVVLTGINLGDFGVKNGETFFDLMKELETVNGIERFRISSIEPNLLSDDIIEFVARSQKFVPHFHIPLQSAYDPILKKMRRKYSSDLYTNKIEKIKRLMPHCAIGVDVIVGFPGESEDAFLHTYNYLNALDITYLHVFPYSERQNTTAIKMKNVVHQKARLTRAKQLRILSEKKKKAFYLSQKGLVRNILWEEENKQGLMYGYTENYLRAATPYNPELINTCTRHQLEDMDGDGVFLIPAPVIVE